MTLFPQIHADSHRPLCSRSGKNPRQSAFFIHVGRMTETKRHMLPKKERLCSRILIERLFTGGSKSLPAFPLRIVYMPVEGEGLPTVTMMVSVSKKRFKRAVKRNRVKRQIREAYRKQKDILLEPLLASGKKLAIAFIWLDNELHGSAEVNAKVKRLLQLTAERIVL